MLVRHQAPMLPVIRDARESNGGELMKESTARRMIRSMVNGRIAKYDPGRSSYKTTYLFILSTQCQIGLGK